MNSYPLTYQQLQEFDFCGLWKSHLYNNPQCIAVKLTGSLDIELMKKSFTQLLTKNDSLRTRIFFDKNTPRQNFPLENLDTFLKLYEGLDENDCIVSEKINDVIDQPANIDEKSLFRAALLKFSEVNFILIIVIDHILVDGVSLANLVKKLCLFYNKNIKIDEPYGQYSEYITSQYNWLQSNRASEHIEYWKNFSLNTQSTLNLQNIVTIDEAIPPPPPSEFFLNQEFSKKLTRISLENGVTLHILLLAAYKLILMKWTSEESIAVNSIISARNQKIFENSIGLFCQSLITKVHTKNLSFFNVLELTRSSLQESYSHRRAIPAIENLLNIPMFNFVNYPLAEWSLDKLNACPMEPYKLIKRPIDPYNGQSLINLCLRKTDDGIAGYFHSPQNPQILAEKFSREFIDLLSSLI